MLKLDADDELVCSPENWERTAAYLDTRSEISFSRPLRDLRSRGAFQVYILRPALSAKHVEVAHALSRVRGRQVSSNTLYAANGLRVCDHRDSQGEGARIAYRNLKVLLREWETGEAQDDFRAGRPQGRAHLQVHLGS